MNYHTRHTFDELYECDSLKKNHGLQHSRSFGMGFGAGNTVLRIGMSANKDLEDRVRGGGTGTCADLESKSYDRGMSCAA